MEALQGTEVESDHLAQPCPCGGLPALSHVAGGEGPQRPGASGELNSCRVHHLHDSGMLGAGTHWVPLYLVALTDDPLPH